jgi:SAM-dependent methyltransferase
MTPIACPACNQNEITGHGKLRQMRGVIKLSDPGNLYECASCGLLFRYPYISPSEALQIYEGLPEDLWVYNDKRADFHSVVKLILRLLPSGNILDVGCHRGDFLNMLPNKFHKYGVEPSESARNVAIHNGINLVGTTIDNIEINHPMLHIITLFDVIEHIHYPLNALQTLIKLLVPGGILALSTGNTKALPWRLMQNDYWYYFTEHVCFFCPGWFRWASKQLSLDLVLVKRFSHFQGPYCEKWRQFARCVAYWSVRSVENYHFVSKAINSIYPFNKVKGWDSPPNTNLWSDHMVVVLKARA